MEPIDAVRLLSAFGTAELSFASLMLSGVINVACDKREPESARINEALAAVTGIGAGDEIEAMLAAQMVTTHLAAMSALRRLKGSENVAQQDSNGNLGDQAIENVYDAARGAATLSRQGSAKSHCRAREC